jgi:hypothetical protein
MDWQPTTSAEKLTPKGWRLIITASPFIFPLQVQAVPTGATDCPFRTLPLPAKLPVFAGLHRGVFLKHMKNKNKTNGAESGATNGKGGNEVGIDQLPRSESYALLGLELGQEILEKLKNVEESVAILARQKARELNPEEPEGSKAQ